MRPKPSVEPHISAHADPEGETPWAMQLVVRLEKQNPAGRTEICEAAAMAVVHLLAGADQNDQWRRAVERWEQGRIRKHCRRARGAKWERLAELDGVTVEWRGVEVRALVPGPVDAIPELVRKLQLSGTEPGDPNRISHMVAPKEAVVIAIPADTPMGLGKAAAAAGHAAQLTWMQMDAARRERWCGSGPHVKVIQPDGRDFQEVLDRAQVVARDAGFTEVDPGTITAAAYWQDWHRKGRNSAGQAADPWGMRRPGANTRNTAPSGRSPEGSGGGLIGWKRAYLLVRYQGGAADLGGFRAHVWDVSYLATSKARCVAHPDHWPPVEDCVCGFWAKNRRRDIEQRCFAGAARSQFATSAVCQAAMWGREVIEAQHGYRAERQTILGATLDGRCVECGQQATLGVGAVHWQHRQGGAEIRGVVAMCDSCARWWPQPLRHTPSELCALVGTEVTIRKLKLEEAPR